MTLNNYAVVSFDGNFYYFGGMDNYGVGALNGIYRLSPASWTWTTVGTLNAPRYQHAVIKLENEFMVYGGSVNQPEACTLNDGLFTCERLPNSLPDRYLQPQLFPVSDDYVNC